MAHDLGHPPFGHIAEAALQKAVSSTPNAGERVRVPEGLVLADSFEGNAQSFRIVTRLSFGRFAREDGIMAAGLNLTAASLSAIQKYPWLCNDRPEGVELTKPKWGAYDSERDVLYEVTRAVPGSSNTRIRLDGMSEHRSLTAQAMDWADDVTYAIHDVEDFCRASIIPARILRAGEQEGIYKNFVAYCVADMLEDKAISTRLEGDDSALTNALKDTLGELPGYSSTTRAGREGFRMWGSHRVDLLTSPAALTLDLDNGVIECSTKALLQVEVLKRLTRYFVISHPALASAQVGQKKVIRELFIWLSDWTLSGAYHPPEESAVRVRYPDRGLPYRLVDILDIAMWDSRARRGYRSEGERVARGVCDYIASLTEAQAIELHQRLNGGVSSGMLDDSFQY